MDTETLRNELQQFLNDLDFGYITIQVNEDPWYYEPIDEIVNVSIFVDSQIDKLFKRYCRTLGLAWDCPCLFLSMMHEVGHAETIDDFDVDVWELSDIYVMLYEATHTKPAGKKEIMTYFDSPRERAATKYAVDFCNIYKDKLEQLWERLVELN